jgi:hypothetical protein
MIVTIQLDTDILEKVAEAARDGQSALGMLASGWSDRAEAGMRALPQALGVLAGFVALITKAAAAEQTAAATPGA